MDKIFVRRCINGKSYVACADGEFAALNDRKCPFSGEPFEPQAKIVDPERSEIMGLNFDEAVAGIKANGIHFGQFRISLGETVIIQN